MGSNFNQVDYHEKSKDYLWYKMSTKTTNRGKEQVLKQIDKHIAMIQKLTKQHKFSIYH